MKHLLEFFDIDFGKVIATIAANVTLSLVDINELIKIAVGVVSLVYISRKTFLLFRKKTTKHTQH